MQPQSQPTLHAPHFSPAAMNTEPPSELDEQFQLPYFDDEAMRRIQACVLACESFSTADLEAGILLQMQQTLKEVVPLLQDVRSKGTPARSAGMPLTVDTALPPQIKI